MIPVKAVAVMLVVVMVLAPMDVPKQCGQQVFARANPGLCFDDPFPDFGGGHGGGDGGLLGGIGRILHGITGGLL